MLPLTLILTTAFHIASTGAETLLTQMDAKIAAAKTLRIEFEIRAAYGTDIKGVLVLGDRNRYRLEVSTDDFDKFSVVVGDGKRVGEVGWDRRGTAFRPLPSWYTEVLKSWLGRGGTVMSIHHVERLASPPGAKRPGPDDGPQVSNPRLLPDEAVNGAKCYVVGYNLSWRHGEAGFRDAHVRVWIDPKTKLPVHREMSFPGQDLKGRPSVTTFTATHTKFELDPALDDRLFDPPTEAELLLAQMDAKIRTAKSLRIEFEIRHQSWNEAEKKTLVVGEGNRFRYEDWHKIRVRGEDRRLGGVTVSDGMRVGSVSDPDSEFRPVPEWHNDVLKSWLGRGGTYLSMLALGHHAPAPGAKKPGPNDGPRLSNVRQQPDAEANGVKCRVVSYDLSWKMGEHTLDAGVRVWIDPKTKLPVRREAVLRLPDGPDSWTVTATHTKFEVDPKLDDGLFKLPTEAELLLAQMDAKIRTAKSLRIEFEIRGDGAAKDIRPVKGSLTLADRNRFRYEDESFFVKQLHKLVVSDGKRIGDLTDGKSESRPLPEWHNEALKSWLGRGGTFVSVAAVWHHAEAPGGKKPTANDGPKLSDVRLLPDEEVGGVKCRVVGYDLAWRLGIEEPTRARVRVWIDPKTKLPVRREMTFQNQLPEGPFTATHTKFEIDPKLDDKLFELPEEPRRPSSGNSPMVAYALALPAFLLSVPTIEAELLLLQMDAKIAAAKTLHIEYSLASRKGEVEDFRGALMLAEGNRVRNKVWAKDAKGGHAGFPIRSDGRELLQGVWSEAEGDGFDRTRVPDWYNAVLQSWLGRGGTLLSAMGVPPPNISTGKKPGPNAGPRTSNVKLLPDEQVNGVKARVVEYDLDWRTNPDEFRTARVRLWIDSRTGLPLRRTMAFRGADGDTMTETYKRFEIDPDLDDVLFELPTEADLLLGQMDAKIRAARTLRIELELKGPDPGPGRSTALLVLGDRNRFRIESREDGLDGPAIIVSDGKRFGQISNPRDLEFRPVPDWHNEVLRSWLARGGTVLSVAEVTLRAKDGKRPGPGDGPRVSNVRALPDEEVNGVKCRVVGYDLTWRAFWEFRDARVRVWIDRKTKLPVRREMTFQEKKLKGTWTATHTKFEIDPKLDDKLFELPK